MLARDAKLARWTLSFCVAVVVFFFFNDECLRTNFWTSKPGFSQFLMMCCDIFMLV